MRNLLFFLCLVFSTYTYSQDPDSSADQSVAVQFADDDEEDSDSFGLPDSTQVTPRSADPETLQRLRSDPALQYQQPPTVAESLWDRFLIWLNDLISSLFDTAVSTDWGQLMAYVIAIVLAIVLIMTLLRVNAFKVFYSGQGASTFRYDTLDENIHEMDFDKLIREASSNKDYRLATRLVFLYALKMLSDKDHIHWNQGKTNHDYLDELKREELKPGFSDLNYYFEYAWYGNFKINAEMFNHVQDVFQTWRTHIK